MSLSEEQSAVFEDLLQKEDEQLYAELGLRARAMVHDFSVSGSYSPRIADHTAQQMGPQDELIAFGRRLFRRLNREAYNLVCGSQQTDQKDRSRLADVFPIGESATAAALATLLIAHLGLAPAVAAVMAALIVRRVFRPAYEETCSFWKEKLPSAAE